jgi:hypothetical protein
MASPLACRASCRRHPQPLLARTQDGGAGGADEGDTKLMETYVKATSAAVADESVHM